MDMDLIISMMLLENIVMELKLIQRELPEVIGVQEVLILILIQMDIMHQN